MADPFQGDDGDFPIATWLKESMETLMHCVYDEVLNSTSRPTDPGGRRLTRARGCVSPPRPPLPR